MNSQFSLLHGTAEGEEIQVHIFIPAHGLGAAHQGVRKLNLLLNYADPKKVQSPDHPVMADVSLLMTKAEARAIASALMGVASEL